jgi:hypothetical protein
MAAWLKSDETHTLDCLEAPRHHVLGILRDIGRTVAADP